MESIAQKFSQIADDNNIIEPIQDDRRVVSEVVVGWDELLRRLDEGWEVEQELDKNEFLMKKSANHREYIARQV